MIYKMSRFPSMKGSLKPQFKNKKNSKKNWKLIHLTKSLLKKY
jgi:hypothetical protein